MTAKDWVAQFPFTWLSWDLQYLIVNAYLSPKDLYSLALVSRMMNELAHLALYNKVRLLYGLKYSFLVKSHFQEKGDSGALREAQDTFIRQVTSHPELASHVQELEWEQKGIADPSPGRVFLECFPLLENVSTIHLVGACAYDIRELNLEFPPIFPRVQIVAFSGCTGLNFAMAVLHTPSRLRSLTLDCLSTNTCIGILVWMQHAKLTSLRQFKLRLGISRYAEPPREVFKLWRTALESTTLTVRDLYLGFVPKKGGGSKTAALTLASLQFQTIVFPYFLEKPVSALRRLTIDGIIIQDEGLDGLERVYGQLNISLVNH